MRVIDLQRSLVRIAKSSCILVRLENTGNVPEPVRLRLHITLYAPVTASYVYATVTHSPAPCGTMYSGWKKRSNLTIQHFDTHSRLLLESAPVFWYVRPLIFLDRMMIENPPLDDGGIQLGNAGWKAGPRPLSW
jgi:hypothetical protein